MASGEVVLAAVPGVSVGIARALLDKFGCVAGVAAASEGELRAVPGVGRTRAVALRDALLC